MSTKSVCINCDGSGWFDDGVMPTRCQNHQQEKLNTMNKDTTTPRGKVPLSVKDPTAQDLLWEYAQRRRSVDAEFSDDLEAALLAAGYSRPVPAKKTVSDADRIAHIRSIADQLGVKWYLSIGDFKDTHAIDAMWEESDRRCHAPATSIEDAYNKFFEWIMKELKETSEKLAKYSEIYDRLKEERHEM
jgi:hypothetical protein